MTMSKEDILLYVTNALRDNNNQVTIESVDSKYNGNHSWSSTYGENKDYMPTPQRMNDKLGNRMHGKSFKVGKDISIKHTTKNTYVVRVPGGEANFNLTDKNFKAVFGALKNKYELGDKIDYMERISEYAPSKDLKEAAKGKIIPKDNKSKYEKAKEQLESLGVEPKRLAEYIAMQQKQNS